MILFLSVIWILILLLFLICGSLKKEDQNEFEIHQNCVQSNTQYDHSCKRIRGRVRRLTGVLETHCGSGDSSNNEIETQKRNNISNVYMDTACCMPCKMQHQSSLPSSPMSAFFHLSFNDEDDSHSSEDELEKINSKGMLQDYDKAFKRKKGERE